MAKPKSRPPSLRPGVASPASEVDALEQLLLFATSLVANVLSAAAGGGAGLVQLPILIFLGLPFSVALATHKAATIALGIGATLRHARSSKLDVTLSLIVIAVGLLGVVAGATAVLLVPEKQAKLALGVLTVGMGLYSIASPSLGTESAPRHRDTRGYLIGALLIWLIGFLNGSLTSGTGLLLTLWLVRWFGLDYKTAVAHTLVLVGLFWNSAGALTLGLQAEIKWDWLPALLAGSLIGGFLGAHLSIVKSNRFVKRLFEVVTLLVGLKLLVS